MTKNIYINGCGRNMPFWKKCDSQTTPNLPTLTTHFETAAYDFDKTDLPDV